MCVQRFDDSLNSAIHITYRNSLRSSSLREPRDPLPKVVFNFSHKVKKSFRQNKNRQSVHQQERGLPRGESPLLWQGGSIAASLVLPETDNGAHSVSEAELQIF
jgi:hypothetical protein